MKKREINHSNSPDDNILEELDYSHFFDMMPLPFQELLLEHIKELMPQRKTDIWYEDENKHVWIMRKNNEYVLPKDCGSIWKLLDGVTVEEIVQKISLEYDENDKRNIYKFLCVFFLNAYSIDIITLYPQDMATDNLTKNISS